MGNHSQGGGNSKRDRDKKSGGNDDPIHEIVKGVSEEDEVWGSTVNFTFLIVAMIPDQQFFQHEEEHNSNKHIT
jgi:hypothetical protein